MSENRRITALQCPNCGGPVNIINATCPSCGVGLSFDYAEMLGVQDYRVDGRDTVLDAALLALVEQEANNQSIEVVPALSGNRILVYVRHLKTGKLVCDGQIESLRGGEEYTLMGDVHHWKVKPQVMLGKAGRIYRLGQAYSVGCHRLAEGEAQLGDIPEIQQWVNDCIAIAFPKPEPATIPAPKRVWYNPFTWGTVDCASSSAT